jgi:hypothetical protein
MAVGILVTKGEIDSRMGDLARSFQGTFADAAVLKSFFDSAIDADLIALGYTAGEVAILKSAIADVHQLFQIYSGAATLTTAKDFTTFLRQLWGVGAQ